MKKWINNILNIISLIILFTTIIALFVPLNPMMPSSGLDPSWGFGFNQAVAQKLSFGKDIIYTYGPYSSIYTKNYNPSTDLIMLIGSIYLSLSFFGYIFLLSLNKKNKWPLIILTSFILIGFIHTRDGLLFSIPLIIAIITNKLASFKKIPDNLMPILIILLFGPLGILPLIKGSILILCLMILFFCIIYFIIQNQKKFIIYSILSPIILMVVFWIISGQPIVYLPSYFINMIPLSSGYTEAMALKGNIHEVILYVLVSMFLLLSIFSKKFNYKNKFFLIFIFLVFLFLGFKAGFVRHDGHAIISNDSILIAISLLYFVPNNKKIALMGTTLALITYLVIFTHYTYNPSIKTLIISDPIKNSKIITYEFIKKINYHIKTTYVSSLDGLKNRIYNKNYLKDQYNKAIAQINSNNNFPLLGGNSDIYSYNQSSLIASGNKWNPRPIFQSYSAYTPSLIEINKNHLIGNKAPDNIFFKVETIDYRLPSMDDGASWPYLLNNYRSVSMTNNNYLILKKKDHPQFLEEKIISEEIHTFGEKVNIPNQNNNIIFLKININPTFLGKLISILYKPSQIYILVEFEDNTEKQFRVISGMLKNGLIISPLIENTKEFEMLYKKNDLLQKKSIRSITIAPNCKKSFFWNKNYKIIFSEIRINTANK